ncbi:hypothetical protein EJ05DRAFT_239416 [Pseudovirgaria hyperparasitica]|uniref:Cysteine protease n=1 Tax=Pseudovirgaria hyperparasitica TaxID=470096 RepID=A0A6A6WFB9_9PEZI|nr:uncharacterized protein EJ05DRAFT_239416 [Pseudovirgaria hyperparasitica]KAF2760680.1 hypothetical protein EJ05DRAFT_239416 [Pseudovirgaria hyperparasitica]
MEDLGRYSKRIVQRLWNPAPKYDDQSPIWCLGQIYRTDEFKSELPEPVQASTPGSTVSYTSQTSSFVAVDNESYEDERANPLKDNTQNDDDGGWPTAFLDDFEAKIWLTYRSNFQPIPKSQDPKALASMSLAVRIKNLNQDGFTSDTGWGCMIRSGQSILANALLILNLGRKWRRGATPNEERKLLSLFADDPSAPFSVHRFVEYGAAACGKHPGEWFGPSAAARSIQHLANSYTECQLRVYITCDSADVYEDSFFNVAKSAGAFHPTLVLVSIRLGIDRVTPVYWEALKNALQMPQSIGIAGYAKQSIVLGRISPFLTHHRGRPAASHYFVGMQSQTLFYLDPHHTRPLLPFHVDPSQYTREDVDSCHTRRIRRLNVPEMDPSMLIAFLIKDEDDWKLWRHDIACVQGKPIVHVADTEPPTLWTGDERERAIDDVQTFDDTDEEGL